VLKETAENGVVKPPLTVNVTESELGTDVKCMVKTLSSVASHSKEPGQFNAPKLANGLY